MPVGRLDNRHPAAEPGKCLRQFNADRSAADDGQPGRQFPAFEDGFVGVVADFGDSRDRRNERLRSGCDHEALAADDFLVDADFMGIEEAGRTEAHIATVATKALGVVVLLDMGNDAVDPVQHPVDVDFRVAVGQTDLRGVAHPVRQTCAVDECLAGHAAAVQAVAAEVFGFLDQRHPQTQLPGNAGDDQPARATADHHYVLFSAHRSFLFSFRSQCRRLMA